MLFLGLIASISITCKREYFISDPITGGTLVTQPMLQMRPNQMELRSMDCCRQFCCRFRKCKRKISSPLLLINDFEKNVTIRSSLQLFSLPQQFTHEISQPFSNKSI